jgi:hypothetical protein
MSDRKSADRAAPRRHSHERVQFFAADNVTERAKAALGIWRSSTPAGATLVPAGGEHMVVASEDGEARKQ